MEAILERRAGSEDVEKILCGDRRVESISNTVLVENIKTIEEKRRAIFIRMVKNILMDKEEDERAR